MKGVVVGRTAIDGYLVSYVEKKEGVIVYLTESGTKWKGM